MPSPRVCLIGAGPSGVSVLHHFNKLKREGRQVPEVVCFEKQSDWGGLWNFTWRTGLDEHGEPVHGSMYKHLWSNAPKELLEFPDYTFQDHFGGATPSFPPRLVLRDYLESRWKKYELGENIQFNKLVRAVSYNEGTNQFTIVVKDLLEDRVLEPRIFDYVVVATGHYSTPNVPTFQGLETFPGRIIHSHDFKDAQEFKSQRVLLIGSSYSAEDIAMQIIKFGGCQVICTYRNHPMGFNWPDSITEKPLVQKFVGNTCHFKDGSIAEVDAVIFCTGYQHNYSFMAEDLRLKCQNTFYPPHVFKGTLYLEGGDMRCFYVGLQDQCYTFTMFDVEARWVVKVIVGDLRLPGKDAMVKDSHKWLKRLTEVKDVHEMVDFQAAFVDDLAMAGDYGYDVNVVDMKHVWLGHKVEDVLTYRDHAFISKYTGTQAAMPSVPFMKAYDESLEGFLAQKVEN